jgi:hypothetical protein
MTIRDLFTVRFFAAGAPVLALALAGCGQQTSEAPHGQPAAVALAPQPVAGEPKVQPVAAVPQPQQPKSEPPGPTFTFTPDLTGKGLSHVVAPSVVGSLSGDHARAVPKPRTVPSKVMDPDATGRASYEPPLLLPPKPVASRPGNPPEKVPINFGAGADDVPAKPVLPVTPVVTERARDVNVPPPAPVLGRPASDRVSLDDPTSELGNAEVVAGVVKAPLAQSGFLKVVVPDPFELADQVKPKVTPGTEPSPAPVTVNPQRVK